MPKKLNKFKVLNFKYHKKEEYDVLPYFRNCWVDKGTYNKSIKKNIKTKDDLKKWVISKSQYMFWARCEYEFLMASWPFGTYNMRQELKEFLAKNPNLDDMSKYVDISNIITQDMEKIDIHQQIMMNIDIIVDILYKEFKLDKKDDKRRVATSCGGDN